jgi:hypothetical protein
VATLLTHVNNTLRLIGEQPLANTASPQGSLAKQMLESALITTVAQTRYSSFLTLQTLTVSATDYLTAAFALPARCIQLKNIWLRQPTNSTPSFKLVKLTPRSLETLYKSFAYCVVGSNVFIGSALARPFDVSLEGYFAPAVLTLVDSDTLAIPDEVVNCMEAVAAATLSVSYLDDFAQAAQLQKRAEAEILQLRQRAGAMRAPISWLGATSNATY